MNMTIMMKNIPVININIKNGIVTMIHQDLIPFDLYIEDETDFDTCINNRVNFDAWRASRLLSLDRENSKNILNACNLAQIKTDAERAKAAQTYHCLSLTDAYWVQEENENLDWNKINLYIKPYNTFYNIDISLLGERIQISNTDLLVADLSTNGVSPKAWNKQADKLVLYKADICNNNYVEKEVIASKIIKEYLQDCNTTSVHYDHNMCRNQIISKCQCFTNENIHLVTAEQYKNNYDITKLIQNRPDLKESFCYMVIMEYLTGNADNHNGNWGFLYDDNKNIISFAPLYDFNHCFEAKEDTISLPYKTFYPKSIWTQLEAALDAVLQLKNKDFIYKNITNHTEFSHINPEYKEYFANRQYILQTELQRVKNNLLDVLEIERE